MFICWPQGIQDVGDFVSSVEPFAVCQLYNGSQWYSCPERVHLSLKWTIDTLSTISIRSVNGPFERCERTQNSRDIAVDQR